MLGGYVGKILRVNLSNETFKDQPLPDEAILRKYVGCFGLGLRILYDELPPGIAASDPENLLIFTTGPLTGTEMPSSSNTTITTLNYDTGYTVGRSHSHGYWGPYLKFAGYDGLIVEGASNKPCYLWIHEGGVELRDAAKFWGRDTHETEELVKEDIGVAEASVAAIGPAGESLVAGATVENDRNHSFSHCGVGAIMGSKKLKAIAVYGTNELSIADEDAVSKIAAAWKDVIPKSGVVQVVMKGGVPRSDYKGVKDLVGLCVKNYQTTQLDAFGEGMSKQIITPKPSFGCPIECSYDVEVTYGRRKGYVASLCGGGENMEGASSIFGVSDTGDVFYLTDLFDRMGVESATVGSTMALAFECYERGLITKQDTGGLELKWGDADAVEALLRKVVKREGIGDILAMGPKRAAEKIGGDAVKLAGHIKGAGWNMHDWRSTWSVLFGQFVSSSAGWPAPGVTWTPEPDLGYHELLPRFDTRPIPEATRKTGIKKMWEDCNGCCWFAAWGVPGSMKYSAEGMRVVVGWRDFTPEEALTVGERVLNLERIFNIQRGLRPMDDLDVPPRFLEAPPDGLGKGHAIGPHVPGMVMEYYRLMGWDEKTGKPWRSTLKRLGMEEYIEDVWG